MSSGFESDNIENAAILRDFIIFLVENIENEAMLHDFLIF